MRDANGQLVAYRRDVLRPVRPNRSQQQAPRGQRRRSVSCPPAYIQMAQQLPRATVVLERLSQRQIDDLIEETQRQAIIGRINLTSLSCKFLFGSILLLSLQYFDTKII